METSKNQLSAKVHSIIFPHIDQVTSPSVSTKQAAYYMNRKEQTMRAWACLENGPIRPIRINGRLAWPVKEIKKVLGLDS